MCRPPKTDANLEQAAKDRLMEIISRATAKVSLEEVQRLADELARELPTATTASPNRDKS